jgi:1-acyl-sn-glycerol-3-phosphate acyltransferase
MPLWLIFALAIVAALAGAAGAFYAALPWTAQPLLRMLLGVRYRVKVTGRENMPRTGPVLIVSNHLSWLDGFFIAGHTPRRGQALVSADILSTPVLGPMGIRAGMIPTPFSGPRAIRDALQAAGKVLDQGKVLAIFPEGQISRNGMVGPFQRGLEAILRGRGQVLVVPVALDNLWGSVFSASDGRFFRKVPQGWRRTVVVSFGAPMTPPVTACAVRQAVVEAAVAARAVTGTPAHALETLDPALPRWVHPELGLLTASAADYDDGNVRQCGGKPGSVGLPVPGVAIRAVDGDGNPVPPDADGRLEARVAGRPGWVDTGARGSLDRDGFVQVVPEG